jgi:hypothetical protein
LNRTFRKSTPGGREGGAHLVPADAPLDLADPDDGEADFGTDFDQPGSVAENPRQHLPVGFHIAQVSAALFAKGNDGATVIDDDRLQGADQALHGSCPLKHEPHKISAIWRAWIRIPKIAEAIERARRLALSHRG